MSLCFKIYLFNKKSVTQDQHHTVEQLKCYLLLGQCLWLEDKDLNFMHRNAKTEGHLHKDTVVTTAQCYSSK